MSTTTLLNSSPFCNSPFFFRLTHATRDTITNHQPKMSSPFQKKNNLPTPNPKSISIPTHLSIFNLTTPIPPPHSPPHLHPTRPQTPSLPPPTHSPSPPPSPHPLHIPSSKTPLHKTPTPAQRCLHSQHSMANFVHSNTFVPSRRCARGSDVRAHQTLGSHWWWRWRRGRESGTDVAGV